MRMDQTAVYRYTAEEFLALMKQYKEAQFMYSIANHNYLYNTVDTSKMQLDKGSSGEYITVGPLFSGRPLPRNAIRLNGSDYTFRVLDEGSDALNLAFQNENMNEELSVSLRYWAENGEKEAKKPKKRIKIAENRVKIKKNT
jgi:hypothetical protein